MVTLYRNQQKRLFLVRMQPPTPVLPPECPLHSGQLADHHQRGQCSLSIEKIAHLPPKGQRQCCIQIRVTLGDRGGDQPPPPHAWEGGFIPDILQGAWPDNDITRAMVLSPGEAILFFGKHSKNEGLPYCKARGIEFGLGGPFNWAGRSVQIEALRKTVQEGHHAILEAVVEKKTKATGSG